MGRRRFSRPLGERRYKKMFVIAAEGAETEPAYFKMFGDAERVIHIQMLSGKNKSAPPQVLKRMNVYLKNQRLKADDQAWLVVDTDQWTEQQLNGLHQWTGTKPNYHLAVTNPKFEYWLLLHFEDGHGVGSSRECSERLLRRLPNYEKGNVDVRQLAEGVAEAIRRAREKDSPPCADWPRTIGTTVYRLVEQLT
ncbi:MAG TPA: RloB family protein [Desulfuromonadales bacterium]|nr:RloB family protein [Desulfuromonadales bacterium]